MSLLNECVQTCPLLVPNVPASDADAPFARYGDRYKVPCGNRKWACLCVDGRLSDDHTGSPDVARARLGPARPGTLLGSGSLLCSACGACKLFRVFNFQTLIKMLCVSPGNSVKLTTTGLKADYVATYPDMLNQFPHTTCFSWWISVKETIYGD